MTRYRPRPSSFFAGAVDAADADAPSPTIIAETVNPAASTHIILLASPLVDPMICPSLSMVNRCPGHNLCLVTRVSQWLSVMDQPRERF